ncbi:MAG: stage II sporulation protein M [Thermoanaerobaculia bacterium]
MILDLERFLTAERPGWLELEKQLDILESDPHRRLTLPELRRFHYLYQRTSADLAEVQSFTCEPELRRYLEALVSRAFGESHEVRSVEPRLALRRFFTLDFPRAFRRHLRAFALAVAVTAAGCLFGGLAIALDTEAKQALIPFDHLAGDPADRVAEEERADEDRLSGHKASFSSMLMTHNTRVAIFCLALGLTWGLGTLVLLFYNGVILGAIAVDYVAAGQTSFLLGWLLPHGAIEIPAFVLAGQAGLILASALLGRGDSSTVAVRLRNARPDLVLLISGVAVMLIWAGLVEAFLSQYHEPALPYAFKIAFGLSEIAALALYLRYAGLDKHPR